MGEFSQESQDFYAPKLKYFVWKHILLSKTEKEIAVCSICQEKLPYRSAKTTSLKKHLERKHHDVLTKDVNCDGGKQLTIKESVSRSQKSDAVALPLSQNLIDKMICCDMEPISIVEHHGLRVLLNYLEPRYDVPFRKYTRERILPDLYSSTKTKLLNAIQTADSVSLTTDGWKSRATDNYVTVTAN